jgi:hypothetical protein
MRQDAQDMLQRDWQAAQEQAVEYARARASDIKTFERMWLALGAVVLRAANNNHRAEIDEALGIFSASLGCASSDGSADSAGWRSWWSGNEVASPIQPTSTPPRSCSPRRTPTHRQRVEGERAALKQLKEETKRERAALESFIVKRT